MDKCGTHSKEITSHHLLREFVWLPYPLEPDLHQEEALYGQHGIL